MILDLGSFIIRGLMVDRVHPKETWGDKVQKGQTCKTTNETVEDRETTDLSVMAKC